MRKLGFTILLMTITIWTASGFLLAGAHMGWADRLSRGMNYERLRSLIKVFDLGESQIGRKGIDELIAKNVREAKKGKLEFYECVKDGKVTASAMNLDGHGRYGPIKGVIAVDESGQVIKAMDIYEQHESAGLGARIASPKWLAKFKGRSMINAGIPGIVISNTEKGPNIVDGITGASMTTHQISKIVNLAVMQFLSGGQQLMELNLKLTADDVTRATPGYPKFMVKPPHLREEVKRPAFMVPPGIVNLALNKPVTSSMAEMPIIGEWEQVTDGIKKCGEFDFVEMDLGPQWVQIDLGKACPIFAIAVWHYYKNPIVYNDVIVQMSDDPEFKNEVVTLFNNDHDDSSKLGIGKDTAYYARWWGELVDVAGQAKQGRNARYVRVRTSGGCGGEATRFVEIMVYGKQG